MTAVGGCASVRRVSGKAVYRLSNGYVVESRWYSGMGRVDVDVL